MSNAREGRQRRSVSIRNLIYLVSAVMLLISALLLITTYRVGVSYDDMRATTEDYLDWRRSAYDLQVGSDYLTEQARCFVVTGDRSFLDSYFEEAEVTRRREKALSVLEEYLGDSEAYDALSEAMALSVRLMERECYAMRLTISALDGDPGDYPPAIRSVLLSGADTALGPEARKELARSMVFDETYHSIRDAISDNIQRCFEELEAESESRQRTTSDRLRSLLTRQRLLIVCFIAITLAIMLLTLLLVIRPLLRGVTYIRAEQPIPITGSEEFRFLARTYNHMYENNMEKREHLAYEATHDKLTGLYNRSGYDLLIQNTDMASSVLLVLDIDKFKEINDTFGHEAGDRALAKTAAVLKGSFRSRDHVCRLGGDEFAVIMVNSRSASHDLLQQKLSVINGLLAEGEEGCPPLSVSCGAAFGSPGDAYETVFRAADAALYRVKSRGGCGCEIAE